MIPSASRRAGDRAGSWTVGPAGTRRWLQSLGAVIDPVDAYAWGWEELRRIEAEMAREADRVRPGASVDEAISLLDETQYVVGADPTGHGSRNGTTGLSSSCTAPTSTSPSRCAPSR